jgi:general secretion pathway protein D
MVIVSHVMKLQLKSVCLLLAWLIWSLPLHAETVTLNLKDADIAALISTVAAVTDKNFIIDPRVKGKVTVISSRPMNNDEVYQVFLSILKVHGFAAVPSGEVIKIVPDVNAKQDGIATNVLIISDRARNVDRLVKIIRRIDQVSDSEIEIIQLQHASATEVVRVLTSLGRATPATGKGPGAAARGQVLVADERTNSVLLGRGYC